MRKGGYAEGLGFERYMDSILSVPSILRKADGKGSFVLCYKGSLEDEPEMASDKMFTAVVKRRINQVIGLRVVDVRRGAPINDNVEMNEIKTNEEGRKHGSEGIGMVDVDEDFYDTVRNEMPVTGTRDDSFLYVRRRISGFESQAEFLFRKSLEAVESRGTFLFTELYDAARKDVFLGIVMVEGKPIVLSKGCKEVNVGIRNRSAGIIGNDVRGTFTISVDGLDGSGEEIQSVKLACGYRESDFCVRFGYHRMHKMISTEELTNYYLDNKAISLVKLFDGIVCVSQPGNLRENCLKFIELKTSLFFGEAQISPYDIGSSLLFFFRMFGGRGMTQITNKIIEYVEYALCELDVCKDSAKDLLFLHETCIFINRIASLELRDAEGGTQVIDGKAGCDDFDPKGVCTVSAYYKGQCTWGNVMFSLRRMEHQERAYRGSQDPIVRNTIGDFLLEGLAISGPQYNRGQSPGLSKLLEVYRRLVIISRKGLTRFVNGERASTLIVSILEENIVEDKETLLLYTIVKDISKILPVRVSVLDKALVKCVGEVVSMLKRRIRKLLKKGEGDVEEVFGPIRRFYARLRYLDSSIHEEIFKSDLHHSVEEECFYRLRKMPPDTKTGLKRLALCRKVHEEYLRVLGSVNREMELSYCLEEKKAFMRLYDVRKIKKILRRPEELEKEILKMIGEGLNVNDDIRNRYKLYLYECIKENARMLFGDKYDETMMSVNKCFI
ncbi:hypothetical protein EHEL_060610 [Encephalitozoon hellem ATCC 50504]|uniref:Uncharacterized protein n=1 Tax=Encephalitozoon hellem TaxID=27973 RepID=A0A9Q9F8F4_ENCHE|nr:uncharacterized protein EHEL_060610 [Encephalitozoon hellem ATCC 50504]AFM98434.1 hypothetical protein EHEL_060610 [Encephalitozoon hellem ATCC 50504]UTX43358.1 hypothetical protein GPU96_06g11050 [Encephalitozoon hellem]|eukprot:XP_003887415.1 hypothetical protein EHEL_060610 [Encephalitozoon hellem ATCC 50504]